MSTFLVFWAGQFLSQLGSEMTRFVLLIWAYQQQGTVLSVALLAVCSYVPSVLVSVFSGTFVDRWPKKRVVLAADLVAACCTGLALVLYMTDTLRIGHLYLINAVLGAMSAFQSPASNVLVSSIVPKDQYARASGLQSLSASMVEIFAPIIATAVMAFAGIRFVMLLDLVAFAFAFTTLLLFLHPPEPPRPEQAQASFWQECRDGFAFLKKENGLMGLIGFYAVINLLAAMAYYSVLPAMMLAREGGGELVLGSVNAAIGVGGILGGMIATAMPTPKRRTAFIFVACAVSFLTGDIPVALGRSAGIWIAAMVVSNLPIPPMNAQMMTIFRTRVPLDIQGRVFAIQQALRFSMMPLGYLLGGILCDLLLEPYMATDAGIRLFGWLVGTGPGSGMALLFLFTGLIGFLVSLMHLKNKAIRALDG